MATAGAQAAMADDTTPTLGDTGRIETVPAVVRLNPEQRRHLEAQVRRLVRRLKWSLRRQDLMKLGDPGNVGVGHGVFMRGWDGVALTPPSVERLTRWA